MKVKRNIQSVICIAIILLNLPLLFTSCDKSLAKTNVSEFENNKWDKNKPVTLQMNVLETISNKRLVLKLNHVYGFQLDKLPVVILMTAPDGKSSTYEKTIVFKTEKGEDIADCSGDYCDLSTTIDQGISFSKGTYSFKIAYNLSYETIPNIMAISLFVE